MQPGTYSFRMNMPAEQEGTGRQVNIPVDAIYPSTGHPGMRKSTVRLRHSSVLILVGAIRRTVGRFASPEALRGDRCQCLSDAVSEGSS